MATVGRLVGQYSDSHRVSQSLQALSRESKKLKLYESREGRERIYFAIIRREKIGSASVSRCGRSTQYSGATAGTGH